MALGSVGVLLGAAVIANTIGTLHFLIAFNPTQIQYPDIPRDLIKTDDNYFGFKVPDHYRWLENLNSKETRAFVEAQNNLTDNYLRRNPSRIEIKRVVERLVSYTRSSAPQKVGNQYFTMENSGLQSHSTIYVRDSLYGRPRVFFDPASLSLDDSALLESFGFSTDGRYFVYFTQNAGSDWKTIRFRDLWTGRELADDSLEFTKGSGVVWAPDNAGVFYTRFQRPVSRNLAEISINERLYYHKLGTHQSQDILVMPEFPHNPSIRIAAQVSQDLNYLVIRVLEAFNTSGIYVLPLWQGIDGRLKEKIVPAFPLPTNELYEYVGNEGSMFLFRTSEGTENYKIIRARINLRLRTVDYSQTLIPEDPNRVLDWAVPLTSETLLLRYIDNLQHVLELWNIKKYGRAVRIYRFEFVPGTIVDYSVGHIEPSTLEMFVQVEHFLNPGTTYRCLLNGYYVGCDVFKHERTMADLSGYKAELVSAKSKDGTAVPIFIVTKQGFKHDGTAPALLYGYGGFNVPMLPRFSITNTIFMENYNGVYAQAVIRGGGEFGTNWYREGVLLKKQNSFDDFQAAAEYLITQNLTSPEKLTIQGGSHGGLLVAASVNQRPELFGAAIAQNGVMDLLRFQHFTGGQIWCKEYGCSDSPVDFKNLIKYSPLHNIRVPPSTNNNTEVIQYPGVFVMTADHDDRVVPSHSYKYVAQLQHTFRNESYQTNPFLLRVSKNAGHSNLKSISKLIDDITDVLSFIGQVLGLTFQPFSNPPQNNNNYFRFHSYHGERQGRVTNDNVFYYYPLSHYESFHA